MRTYSDAATALAANAARAALDEAGACGQQVTHLVTASCTGFQAPGVDLGLCESLDLPTDVGRTHIGFMGCHAALNALRTANAFSTADPDAVVLVCCVELCSLHFQYSDQSQHAVSNALFADGAAAVVASARPDSPWGTFRAAASTRLPNTADLMSWSIGDNGFEMTLSPRVPAIVRRDLRPWLAEWLHSLQLSVGDIDAWAVHPGGPRILDACEESLKLSPAALRPSRDILANYGNMSSPTVLFVLDDIRRRCRGNWCVMLAFGPGLVMEAILIELRQ
jgi:predicted naringenin-chalcone synthase